VEVAERGAVVAVSSVSFGVVAVAARAFVAVLLVPVRVVSVGPVVAAPCVVAVGVPPASSR
jgi:hypothetical protein